MKLVIYKLCFFIFVGTTISINSFADSILSVPKQAVTLAYEVKSNPPYYLGKRTIDWKKPGITLEVLKRLEKKLNIKIAFERFPWARGLTMVKDSRVDGIFHASFSKERLDIGAYPMNKGELDLSRQLMTQSYVLYKLKDSKLSWDGKNFEHLKGSIGAVIKYSVVADLKEMNVNVEEVTTQRSNLRKLLLGRIEGVAGLEAMNDIIIKAYPDEFREVVKVFPPIKSKPFFLMLSHDFVKENTKLAEAIWDGIRDIRESSEYDEIAKKYY
mgnify:CR=1 FL=1